MSRRIAAAALILVLMQSLASMPPGGDATGAAGARSPRSVDDWVISGNETFSGPKIMSSNITVESNGILVLENATIMIVQNAGATFAFLVKSGGSLFINGYSSIYVPRLVVEPGADILLNGSQLNVSGMCNVSGNFSILDSEINVTGGTGSPASGSGEPATLILGGDCPGVIRRSTVVVAGGDGAKGADGQGTTGGAGGNASLSIIADEFVETNLTVRAGNGGKGGKPGTTTPHGGSGGMGGSVEGRLHIDGFTASRLNVSSGNGGDGLDGSTTSGVDAGNGGEGGDGGSVDLCWTGNDLKVTGGSNISIYSGHGGKAGGGGQAQSSGKWGGNGGRGGSGGPVVAGIRASGTMSLKDSIVDFRAGYGASGGIYGRATLGGRDGTSGDGGDGGISTLTVRCTDNFAATNSTLLIQAGDSGNGGAGVIGGRGGEGGSSLLNLTVLDSRAQSRALLENSTLSSCGGDGGDGGKALSVGQSQGQPGDGGRGGGAGLYIHCSDNFTVLYSHLRCDQGQRGAADPQDKPGHWGVGELHIDAVNVLMRKSSYSQTMGFVDNNDYWRLESTRMERSNPPLKLSHFLPVVENGTVEEYWDPTIRVQDIMGNTIIDGSVTVTVYNGSNLVASKRTDRYGLADFPLLFARYTAKDSSLFIYTVNAADDSGAFAYPVSVPGTDAEITLTLLSKSHPPMIAISGPDEHMTPYIDALQYLHSDGGTDMYIIEGNAQDHPMNPMPVISAVEVKIGDDGAWIPATFVMVTFSLYKWNLTWDIYNWSLAKLSQYPLGIIPCRIYARSYNDRFWSDDLAGGGGITLSNITVKHQRIPPRPPDIWIIGPLDLNGNPVGSIQAGVPLQFIAQVARSYGTNVTRWSWSIVDRSGSAIDHFENSSAKCSTVAATFPVRKLDYSVDLVCKAFDDQSRRRVELLQAGAAYDEFGYAFDTNDGSIMVTLRVYVHRPPPPPGQENDLSIPIFVSALVIVIILAVLLAAQRLRYNRLRRE